MTLTAAVFAALAGVLTASGTEGLIPLLITFSTLAFITALGSRRVHRTEARDLARRQEIDRRIAETDAQIRGAVILAEIRILLQEHVDAQRTLICEPARVDAVRSAVETLGARARFTVKASPACPPGKILVLDEQALEAP